jgi:hypothetical protein
VIFDDTHEKVVIFAGKIASLKQADMDLTTASISQGLLELAYKNEKAPFCGVKKSKNEFVTPLRKSSGF